MLRVLAPDLVDRLLEDQQEHNGRTAALLTIKWRLRCVPLTKSGRLFRALGPDPVQYWLRPSQGFREREQELGELPNARLGLPANPWRNCGRRRRRSSCTGPKG